MGALANPQVATEFIGGLTAASQVPHTTRLSTLGAVSQELSG
jgi:hypothetical protein